MQPLPRDDSSPPRPLPVLPLSHMPLDPVLMADDPCEAAFGGADPTGPRKYYRARYYDPKIGRFISEDPIGFVAGMNFYAYVENNPVNYTDPFGLMGTNSCSYYKLRCFQSGGKYYCETAQYWCNKFPKDPDPDTTWSGCTRQCLQDCDQDQFRLSCSGNHPNPDSSTDEFSDVKPTLCHIKCYVTSTKCIPR